MPHNKDSRRSFLKQILAGTAVVASATLSGKKAKAGKQLQADQPTETLYKETDNFKKYYQSLR
jgi:hypothetical protein